MNFKYAEKDKSISTVTAFAGDMHQHTDEDLDQMIRAKYIIKEYRPELIQEYLDQLCRVDNLLIIL